MFDVLTIAEKLMYLEAQAREGGYTQTAKAIKKLQEDIATGADGRRVSSQKPDDTPPSQAVPVHPARGEEPDK
jgi:hypothetical protein